MRPGWRPRWRTFRRSALPLRSGWLRRLLRLMHPVLAFSVTGQIEKLGAYAGFAAIIGLAVLSMLYFAQAREVKRLRDWAGRAPERAQELEARVAEEARARLAP